MSLGRMFDDLEGRFAHLEGLDMRAMSDELARAERSQVQLADRFRAAQSRPVGIHLDGGIRVDGIVDEVGEGWVLLRAAVEGGRSLVPMPRIAMVEGLTARARPAEESRASLPRGIGHVLRRLARDRSLVRIRTDGGSCHGRIRAVGADALDVLTSPTGEASRVPGRQEIVVPFAALLLLQEV
ncbi:hypothetical protein [Brachybacterium hainanense]|uniref:Fis family transcriptional regulator n=1 Tax=Brachybacterium hainanense TaxID=1541174 RepID=A0ABV6RBY0_9MICO